MVIRCAEKSQRKSSLCQSFDEPLSAKTSEFSIKTPDVGLSPYFFIDSTGTHLILVYRLRGTESAGLFLSHYDLEGNLKFEGHIAGLHDGSLRDSALNISESSGAKLENAFHIWDLSRLTKKIRGKYSEAMEYTHAVYYPSRRIIEIQCQSLLDCETKIFFDKPALLWKGILYSTRQGDFSNSKRKMRIVDLENWIEGYHGSNTLPLAHWGSESFYQLFGDETFIVHLRDELAHIWCFDKNVKIGEVSESEECYPTAVSQDGTEMTIN